MLMNVVGCLLNEHANERTNECRQLLYIDESVELVVYLIDVEYEERRNEIFE